ncbi:MAG: hypothetical protein K2J12_08940 [Muribaculaceae bacterium]|nr:hypothetical protein [Muribaculaceae bacterium]
MALTQLKRALWMMDMLIKAKSRGMTREELSHYWQKSWLNDNCEKGLSERTFFRLRKELESLFDVEIVCSKDGEKRYSVEQTEDSLILGMLCRLVSDNSKRSLGLHELMLQVMSGMEISDDEKEMIDNIAFKLNKVPYEAGKALIDAALAGEIEGADRAQWAEYEWHHLCIWLDDTYERIKSWVGIHISRKGKTHKGEVRFYIVNETQDVALHARMVEALELIPGEQRKGGYWWFAPRDPSLQSLSYVAFPDLEAVQSITEILLFRLNSL